MASSTDSADFLELRRLGLEALKAMRLDPDSVEYVAAAQHHLRSALDLAEVALEPAVAAAAVAVGGGAASREVLVPMEPLVVSARMLHAGLGQANDAAGVLFDKRHAEYGTLLIACAHYLRGQDPTALNISDELAVDGSLSARCHMCFSTRDLDEDTDNPGIFYCVPCWMAYGDLADRQQS